MVTTTVNGCCPLDCQDSCAWTAEVRDGAVLGVRGRKDHPVTRGVLCAKVKDYEARFAAPDRVLHPLRRTGAKGEGRFERISWQAALDEMASNFRRIIKDHGAEALLPFYYLGSMGVVQRYAPLRVFHALGASQMVGNVCGQSISPFADEGFPIGVDPEETPDAEFIILWGQNTLSTCHHQWHFIEQARRRGATLVAIDPRLTRTAKQCDRHFAIPPGTDAILAAAMARVMITEDLVDRGCIDQWTDDFAAYRAGVMDWTPARAAAATGLAEDDILWLARSFGKAKPALIRSGIAPMQSRQGEVFVRALQALAVIGGHWTRRGGGVSLLSGPMLNEFGAARPDLMAGKPRALDMAKLAQILADETLVPPVKGLMVWSANPAVTQIDQPAVRRALRRDDLFTVVHDHFITDTARYADIVLPATTQFEHVDVQGAWGHHYVSANSAAVAPRGEARSGGALMRALAQALGLDHPALSESDEDIAASALPAGWSLDELKSLGWKKSPTPRMAAPGVKLRISSGPLAAPARADALQLLTPKSHYFLNSTFANMPRQRQSQGTPEIEVNAADAARFGLADGDEVFAHNGVERMRLVLRITSTILPGLAALEGKWWGDDSEDSAAMNRLTPPGWSPAGQPAYNETFVTLARA